MPTSDRRGFSLEIDALFARHRDELLVFLARRTADGEIALDLWAETFAQALAGRRRFRGSTEDEAAAWLELTGPDRPVRRDPVAREP